jgi:hypothetical protein
MAKTIASAVKLLGQALDGDTYRFSFFPIQMDDFFRFPDDATPVQTMQLQWAQQMGRLIAFREQHEIEGGTHDMLTARLLVCLL